MTDQEINEAIAEFCGYKFIVFNKAWITSGDEEVKVSIPDYCNDLNAMHKAETTLLTLDKHCAYWEQYSNTLTQMLGCVDIFHATAKERSKAFLKTIGKYKESKP